MITKTFMLRGMTCHACERLIESALKGKVISVKSSFVKNTVTVSYDPKKIAEGNIKELMRGAGYEVVDPAQNTKRTVSDKVGLGVLVITVLLGIFLVYRWVTSLGLSLPQTGESSSLILLFIIGILTGFHCVSMCGGFIVSYMARNAKDGHAGFAQHLVYGVSKTVSYTIMGALFGLLGGIVSLSIGLRAIVAIAAGVFMVMYGLSMLGLSWLRRFQLNPKWLSSWAARSSASAKGYVKAPLITGLLNGLFIACGPLQAMYLFAAGTGSMIVGALSLAVFGLGTLVILLPFASLASVISHEWMKKFLKVSAIIVMILGLVMFNRGLTLIGSPLSLSSITTNTPTITDAQGFGVAIQKGDYQEISMTVDRYGWSPDTFTLKRGVPVKWLINVKELTSCNNEIIVREYGLDIKLKEGLNTVEFTPTESKTVKWSCWMGMIPGTFVVSDDGSASAAQVKASTTKSPSSCGMGGSCGCGGMRA